MADEPTGGGNPNFFKIFKGAYLHAPSPEAIFTSAKLMLSCVNDVQFMGDCMVMGYTPGDALTVLPPECRPPTEVRIPVVVDTKLDVLAVQTNGTVSLNATTDGMVHLSGVSFNISSNWYAN